MKLDLNPLDVLKIRKVETMPVHFAKMKLHDWYTLEIEEWIKDKLQGRYSITRLANIDSTDSLKLDMFVGFEDHKEMTYFMLACPHLRRN